jgi:cyclic beta-1,2-glucan synthetase
MSEMAGTLRLDEEAKGFRLDRASLIGAVESAAWDGEWYTRATFDDGSALGSSSSREAKIDSLSQSWAVISEGAGEERASTALGSAWTRLVRKEDSLVLLFAPPFEDSKPSPGYIQGYPPGVRENGGQYTHAAVWLAMAYARRGEGDKAGELTRMLNPIEHAREPAQVWRYGVEPYVVSADVYALSGLEGQGGWSWYTGSAAWLYRAWVEDILGLRVRGEAMKIEPAIPSWWDGYQLRYRHGEAVYDIRVENPEHVQTGVVRVEIDGKALHDDWIALESLFMKHRVTILMGNRKSTER